MDRDGLIKLDKRASVFVECLLLVVVMAACNRPVKQMEPTRVIPQTVMVTLVVQKTATLTPQVDTLVDIEIELDQDTAYYQGIIVLAQYYTLLDQGLYKQAYQLLSPSRPNAGSLEEFLANRKQVGEISYRLISAQPYVEWADKQGFKQSPDSATHKRFIIRVFAEGPGGMAGSVTNGIHTFFATVTWEDGVWKIYAINTSPI